MRRFARVALLAVALAAVACSRSPRAPDTVRVLAAASLVDIFQAAAPGLEAERGLRATFQFGSSSELRAQLEKGARADAVVLADEAQMDALDRAGLLQPGTRRDLYRNHLVLVVPNANPARVHGLPGVASVARLGIGEPATVPAGRYARQALERSGVWERVRPHLVFGKDVRVVLGWVARGEVDAGIVYRSDAGAQVTLIDTYPDSTHDPIVFPGAVPKDAEDVKRGQRFLDYLSGPAGLRLAARYGFEPVPNP